MVESYVGPYDDENSLKEEYENLLEENTTLKQILDDHNKTNTNCMVIFSVGKDSDEVEVTFNFEEEYYQQFVALLYVIFSGNIRQSSVEYINHIISRLCINKDIKMDLDRMFAQKSYNGQDLEFDEEDPVISPCDVFRDGDSE